jgi:SOUL heme-binding protein
MNMTKTLKRTALTLLATIVSALVLAMPAKAERVAEPPYTVLTREGEFEVRDYQTQVIAEVTVLGDMGQASNRGFNLLAGYIFGGNAPRTKIAMTAPVTRQQGSQIAMTAPVTRQEEGGLWKVRFIMPAGSQLATMPRPNDPNVRLMEQAGKRFAVIKFSGFGGARTFNRKTIELTTIMTTRRLIAVGNPTFASYDPPWTPPFMRRNEVWIELAKPQT